MADDIRGELRRIVADGIQAHAHAYDVERYEHIADLESRLDVADATDLISIRAGLEAVAKTGWSLTRSDQERQRYDALIGLAAQIGEGGSFFGPPTEPRKQLDDRLDSVAARYVTPKVGVNAVVDDGSGRLLMVQRADRGEWSIPGGYADVGLSGAEVAVKEAFEETGYEVEVVALLGEWDALRHAGQPIPLYSLIYHCWVRGGSEQRHAEETLDIGWFKRGDLPKDIWQDGDPWLEIALRAVEGVKQPTYFDRPRS